MSTSTTSSPVICSTAPITLRRTDWDTDPDQDGPFDVPGSKLGFTVDWTTHDHTGSDTPVTAEGPGSTRLNGTVENTDVYWVMRKASGL